METLSYKTLKKIGYDGWLSEEAPERVLQFGEGNFMRAFVDSFIDQMNEKAAFNSKVVLVAPRAPHPGIFSPARAINEQDGLYTLYLRGFENGQQVNRKRVISCVSRCLNVYSDYDAVMACAENPDLRFITCNTTEAGIVYAPCCRFEDRPPESYPAKLTQFLYRRFQLFGACPGKGFLILACELIDDNGKELKKCVLAYASQWNLGETFQNWIETQNIFCSTLVDRIVTGFPCAEADRLTLENGYEDNAMDTGEVFGFWVIEGPQFIRRELPFEKAGLPVLVTDDYKPYKQRKVRILNGAHTAMVPGAYLAGQNIVRSCMEDDVIRSFMEHAIYQEIIPTLTLPKEELTAFASSVTERFQNPFIDHALLSISLNSTSKWKARVMPSLTGYIRKFDSLPPCLTASLAFYIAFYQGEDLTEEGLYAARPGGGTYCIKDDRSVLSFYAAHKGDPPQTLARAVLSNLDFWGQDLTETAGLADAVAEDLHIISTEGAYALMKNLV